MIGGLLGGGSGGGIGGLLGGGGPLGKLMELLNPQSLMKKLQSLLGGGGVEGAQGKPGGGSPLDFLKMFDPMSLISGLLGGAKARGL